MRRVLILWSTLWALGCTDAGAERDRTPIAGEKPAGGAGRSAADGGSGSLPPPSIPGAVAGAASGAFAPPYVPADAGGVPGLEVHFESMEGAGLNVIKVGCDGECAEVLVVATGGNPPYTFVWEDGSRDAARRVCPTADTVYRVSATDTAGPEAEFAYVAQTVNGTVATQVVDCAPGALCLNNPSFEGTPGLNLDVNFDAPPWLSCKAQSTPDVWNHEQKGMGPASPPPSHGETYLEMYALRSSAYIEFVSEALCAPLVEAQTYSLELDLAYENGAWGSLGDAPGSLELWAGTASCGETQLLWTSPVVSSSWQTHCVTFKAERAHSHITLKPRRDLGDTGIFVDNLVPVPSCGEK